MNKNVYVSLPLGYSCFAKTDLRRNPKFAFVINLAALLIGVGMFIIMNKFVPARTYYDPTIGKIGNNFRKIVLITALVLYIVVHELTHGLAMKYVGAKHVHFGFTGLYAYASCNDFIAKKDYIVIALAPLALWGAVFLLGCLLTNQTWLMLLFYWLQTVNVAGAAGDVFIALKMRNYPQDTLVQDEGTTMCFFSKLNIED